MTAKKLLPVLLIIPVLLLSGCTSSADNNVSRGLAKQFCAEYHLEYSTNELLYGDSDHDYACIGVINNTYVDWEIVFDDNTLRWYFAERGCECETSYNA